MASVAWISFTPVKGLQLLGIDEVELTELGIPGDRRFHLIDERGFLTNSKRVGALQQVRARWDEAAQRLALEFPDGSVVEDEVRTNGERVTTDFYGRPVEGALVGEPFESALSTFTGLSLRLVQPVEPGAGIDRAGEERGPVTLLSQGSLDRLASAAGVDAIDGRRFRMNFGIEGIDAHDEDDWVDRQLQVGEAIVVPRGHVGRCAITKRDPETGVTDLDTLGALATYRRDLETTEPLAFGVFGEVVQPGRVRVGDAVAVRV